MELDMDIVNLLKKCDYLHNMGKQENFPSNCICAKNLDQVLEKIEGLRWQNKFLEELASVTDRLFRYDMNKDEDAWIYSSAGKTKGWNQLTLELDCVLSPSIERKLDALDLPDLIRVNVLNTSIRMACVLCYRAYAPSPFFEKMLEIYQAGHLPCGWNGPMAKGCFIVY